MQNNQDKNNLVNEWIFRAQDDELNISSILKDKDGTPAHICFISQQMAEKYLKALILFFIGNYPKIHDLHKLTALLKPFTVLIIEELKEEILILDPYYIGARYPADIPIESFTWEMAERAYESAKKIKEFVLKNLKEK